MFEGGSGVFLERNDRRVAVVAGVVVTALGDAAVHVAASHHVSAATLESLLVGVLLGLADIGLGRS